MDTFAEISLFGGDREKALEAKEEAFKEIERIEKLFSKFDEDSEVAKVNRLAGEKEIIVSLELFNIIKRALYYSRISKGSFDITSAPLKKGRYRDIILDQNRLSVHFLDKDIKIDLGGIAKGYAVDRAKGILLLHGIESALIDIGGNIYTIGSPPRKKSWQIGIQDPREKDNIIYRLSLKNRAVATSGNYERPSHIIDPANGMPSREVLSVTVVTDSAEAADALSTAIFVMGIEDGAGLIKSLDDTEVFIFDKDDKLVKYP
ncbi:MAG: FAD:protein FMN transferase [Candidatus Omnitrophica bacterium]|nr:FAD:protein FMN transferase [Candidatus Omnitrophota bacterium]